MRPCANDALVHLAKGIDGFGIPLTIAPKPTPIVDFDMAEPQNSIPEYDLTAGLLNMLGKSGDRHKYDYGHAVIVSGPAGQGGAARLAARGALRIGAGLVSVFSSLESRAEHSARLDAVMVKMYDSDQGFADQLSNLKPSAVCIGPNLGLGSQSRAKLLDILALPYPICMDADAITLFAQNPELIEKVPNTQIVMTPHEGELRRLIPLAFKKTTCRATLAITAAQTVGSVVLFKGRDTIVARPNGYCAVVKSRPYENAAWLATAGSGDVLSGFITGLMARGFDAFDAAALGATIHLRCADAIGPGLIAEDLSEVLPGVLKDLLAAAK